MPITDPMASPETPRIKLWQVPLDLPGPQLRAFEATLSPEEQARADLHPDPVLRNRTVAARGWVRKLLGEATGVSPRALSFCIDPHGKPHVSDAAVSFNLAHTGPQALIVIAPGILPVGVDVERLDRTVQPTPIVRRFFSEREIAAFGAIPGAEQTGTFLRMWTRKEAFVKALGVGIADHLRRFDVATGEAANGLVESRICGEPASAWCLRDLDILPGYAAALAVRASSFSMDIMHL